MLCWKKFPLICQSVNSIIVFRLRDKAHKYAFSIAGDNNSDSSYQLRKSHRVIFAAVLLKRPSLESHFVKFSRGQSSKYRQKHRSAKYPAVWCIQLHRAVSLLLLHFLYYCLCVFAFVIYMCSGVVFACVLSCFSFVGVSCVLLIIYAVSRLCFV